MKRIWQWGAAIGASTLVVAAAVAWWLIRPMGLMTSTDQPWVDVEIGKGAGAKQVAQALADANVGGPAWWWEVVLRASGRVGLVKNGPYEVKVGTSPWQLMEQLAKGKRATRKVTFIEGWNWYQVRKALAKAPFLQAKTASLSDEDLMAALGMASRHPEGRFFPDTYVYLKNSTDLEVLKQAAQAMSQRLNQIWALKAANSPLKNPDEALILASIIEKETGHGSDRGLIAGVFSNRLRMGMRLQTDPTVIYGQGPDFKGRLRKVHLETDTPYNTYTRLGLPPTPIAMPSAAALRAAVQPEPTAAIFFVAKGDGTSQFSANLADHNDAVRRYILNRP